MSKYQDLQAAYSKRLSDERKYWRNLLLALDAFGVSFVKHLELPAPTYRQGEVEKPYVRIGYVDEEGGFKAITGSNYPTQGRSIPFTIFVSVKDVSQDEFRDVSITLAISNPDGVESFYCAKFPKERQNIEFRKLKQTTLMDDIVEVLKSELESQDI